MQKKKTTINADFIKLQLMKYWRFDRQYTFVCSESINYSDINALNDKNLIEVEVKISKQDFLEEFSGKSKIKSYKHKILNNIGTIKPKRGYIVPNYYYFCVTKELEYFVLDYLNKNYPKYGLLVCDTHRQFNKRSHIYCSKKAVKIHSSIPAIKVLEKISKRVQSELISLKEKVLTKK